MKYILTGTVYKTLGFGFSAGHCSRIDCKDEDCMPSASVSTSII